jgi:hypothetical protein
MDHKQILRTFISLFLIVFSCTRQVAASSNSNILQSISVKSSTHSRGNLKPGSSLPSQALSITTSFSGSNSVPDQIVFMTTGDMLSMRSWHTAILLGSGKVLVAGGFSNGSYLTSAEIFNPTIGTWSMAGNLNAARSSAPMILLKNGKVLIMGGYPGGSSYISTAELYDPDTNTWSYTGSMGVGRGCFTATLLNNGKVLVAGGDNGTTPLSSAELYDPDSGTWSYTNSMSVGRACPTATLLNTG